MRLNRSRNTWIYRPLFLSDKNSCNIGGEVQEMTRQEIIKIIERCYEVGYNCTECPLFSEDECEDKLMHDVLAFLKEQEAVVRCKDCKYYHGVNFGCGALNLYPKPDWFCADGERR